MSPTTNRTGRWRPCASSKRSTKRTCSGFVSWNSSIKMCSNARVGQSRDPSRSAASASASSKSSRPDACLAAPKSSSVRRASLRSHLRPGSLAAEAAAERQAGNSSSLISRTSCFNAPRFWIGFTNAAIDSSVAASVATSLVEDTLASSAACANSSACLIWDRLRRASDSPCRGGVGLCMNGMQP